ncbi:MAG: biotin/lipoyl-binding carrier protein [Parvibaculales bacterium]
MRIEVKSEIAGQVWKQMANEGDTLAADDTIIILESMKMEIPITAPKSGKIEKLHVGEQDMVAEGQLIATLRTD